MKKTDARRRAKPAARKQKSAKPAEDSIAELAGKIMAGDRRALARAITLIESTRPDHRTEADRLLQRILPATGKSIRVGITGVPGVGKSTFIESFGMHVIGQGHRVAVLAIDPSSRRGGGSILGDKTRMQKLALEANAFIRPSPSGGTLGGVARRTREALLVCEAAGFDVVLVETVGVGQSETAVADMTDMFLLLLQPGGGDELQGLKKGIMEMADLLVVNKADGDMKPAAKRTAHDYGAALRLLRPSSPNWTPEVLQCSALEESGIAEVWQAISRYREKKTASGELKYRRVEQAKAWMWSEVSETLESALRHHKGVRSKVAALEAKVAKGEATPSQAAHRLLSAFLGD
jgi:LAO/AO transport system kinase